MTTNTASQSDNRAPESIRLLAKTRVLEITFTGEAPYPLSFEFLRVYSPSAEVRGHGPGQEVLQTGKKDVVIERIEPIGNYAVCLYFSDGHDSGIYSWGYLHELSQQKDVLWQHYLTQLADAGESRDANTLPPIMN